MEDLFYFWNAFNLSVILTLVLGSGLFIAAGISIFIGVITQVNDPAISFLIKLTGCLLSGYVFSSYIFSAIKDFATKIWGG